MMIGTQLAQLGYRQVIARGFNHGTMKAACRSFAGGNLPDPIVRNLPSGFVVPLPLRTLSRAFVELQEQRHSADYDLSQNFTRAEVLTLVRQAEQALRQFDLVADRTLKKFFLSCLWSWDSITRR